MKAWPKTPDLFLQQQLEGTLKTYFASKIYDYTKKDITKDPYQNKSCKQVDLYNPVFLSFFKKCV